MLISCIRSICNKGLTSNFGIGPRLQKHSIAAHYSPIFVCSFTYVNKRNNLIVFFYRMYNMYTILLLFFALFVYAQSSYLHIPPPPARPLRFKTREQVANYLRSIKNYYDAFQVKLVRRDTSVYDTHSKIVKTINHEYNHQNGDDNELIDHNFKQLRQDSYAQRREDNEY